MGNACDSLASWKLGSAQFERPLVGTVCTGVTVMVRRCWVALNMLRTI